MQRIFLLILTLALCISMCACGENKQPDASVNVTNAAYDNQNLDSMLAHIDTELQNFEKIMKNNVAALEEQLGDSYETYSDNAECILAFYSNSRKQVAELFAVLETASIDCYKCIAVQGLDDINVWNKAMEDTYNSLNEAYEDVYEVLNNSYEKVFDICDGLVAGAEDILDFDAWTHMSDTYWSEYEKMSNAYWEAWAKMSDNYWAVWSGFSNNETNVDAIVNVRPVETTVPEEATEPVETTAPEETTEPVETTVPEETTEPVEPTVPEEITEPVETTVPEEATKPEETTLPVETTIPETEDVDAILTVDNCPDLAKLLALKNPADPFVKTFSSKYRGRMIEFEGNIAYMSNHGSYKTRYDILILAGDYSEKSATGPYFQFVDVNMYDLNFIGNNTPDSIGMGDNLLIVAEVGKYNENTELFELDPVSTRVR